MKITEIETLSIPNAAAVIVRTDEGLEGVGQTSPYYAEIAVQVLHQIIAPFFLGKNPWDMGRLEEECLRATYKIRGTFMLRAMCGIDTALYDLLGKAVGQPVYNLLGGKVRAEVPVYTSSMVRDTSPQEEAERLLADVERWGFRCAKVKIGSQMGIDGGLDHELLPGRTPRLIPYLRQAMGEDFELIADANGGFTPARAVEIGRLLEDNRYYFFEEPCIYFKLENTAQVAADLDIPIAGGEQDNSLTQFERMIRIQAVDVVQPDIGYIGGLTRARRVAEMAETAGLPCTPHCANHSMLQVFTLHLAAAMPACFQYQEYALGATPDWAQDIYDPVPRPVQGRLQVPDLPGWGISLTPGFLKRANRRITRLGVGG